LREDYSTLEACHYQSEVKQHHGECLRTEVIRGWTCFGRKRKSQVAKGVDGYRCLKRRRLSMIEIGRDEKQISVLINTDRNNTTTQPRKAGTTRL
jgi:hypothetical protein